MLTWAPCGSSSFPPTVGHGSTGDNLPESTVTEKTPPTQRHLIAVLVQVVSQPLLAPAFPRSTQTRLIDSLESLESCQDGASVFDCTRKPPPKKGSVIIATSLEIFELHNLRFSVCFHGPAATPAHVWFKGVWPLLLRLPSASFRRRPTHLLESRLPRWRSAGS